MDRGEHPDADDERRQTNVNITQTAQQAILNWQTFNVGKNTTVNIDQSRGRRQREPVDRV